MYSHNDISFIEEVFNQLKISSPESISYFSRKYPTLHEKIQKFLRGKKIKIINNKEILKELDKAASLKEIDLFDENYKIDLTNSYDNIEILVNKSLTVLK